MTFYEFSIITNTGFPYYHLKLKEEPEGTNLYLRFFDFSEDREDVNIDLDEESVFELNAGLVSALYEFARNLNKKIEILKFQTKSLEKNITNIYPRYKGDVLITAQTESYLLHEAVKEKVKLIYNAIVIPKIPLDSALEMLQNEEDFIIDILNDYEANRRIKENEDKINKLGLEYLNSMKGYGLEAICICSFDLSPLYIIGDKYSFDDIHDILRNIENFPKIDPLEWIYRQSNLGNEIKWVFIINSSVGPTVEGLFQPFFYLLFTSPHSYLAEFPQKLAIKFNQILG